MPGSDVSDDARAIAHPAQPLPASVQGPAAEWAEPQLDSVVRARSESRCQQIRPCSPMSKSRFAAPGKQGALPIGRGRLISLTGGAGSDAAVAFSAGKGKRSATKEHLTLFPARQSKPPSSTSPEPYWNHISSPEIDVSACKAKSDFLRNHPVLHRNHCAFTRKTTRFRLKTVLFHHSGRPTHLIQSAFSAPLAPLSRLTCYAPA